MTMAEEYILYCAQEANFCTRSMLIPHKILECEERVKHLEILREHSKKNVKFTHNGTEYVVDNLLIQNITWNGGHGVYDNHPFSEITNDFTSYADLGVEEWWDDKTFYMYRKTYDDSWANGIIGGLSYGKFNHIANYCDLKNKVAHKNNPIKIVEGFLVLEANDGKFNLPPCDTVDEMFSKYF